MMNNSRVRNKVTLQSVKAPVKHEKVEMQGTKTKDSLKTARNRQALTREKKKALQQDVDKLKKKLRHEENIHRALERAFNRPLGVLPRLPPYLPPATLELLAEVAVLEEEVIRLEEQVVHFRQDLYQEAIFISASKRNMESIADLHEVYPNKNRKPDQCKSLTQNLGESATTTAKNLPSLSEDEQVKVNESRATDTKNNMEFASHKTQMQKTPLKQAPMENIPVVKQLDHQKVQKENKLSDQENVAVRSVSTSDKSLTGDSNPNKISEDIVKCLSSIFLRMSSLKNRRTADNLRFLSTTLYQENGEATAFRDPYGICAEFGNRDIGPYKHLFAVEVGTINLNRTSNSLFLLHRLKLLLEKLATVNLLNLSHQEKLAFWINVYNSCVMNSFLEHGIPERPDMVVALMQKAKINVGGHLLDAVTIEHFILRLPYHSKYILSKGAKNDEKSARNKFGLELSEPLVTFALSCGSWSSPAVRVYTASKVENELEVAKREYLQAAVGITKTKFAIPKLLDWYLLDFAKDLESLLDWICIQLPSELGKEAMMCLERGKSEPHSQFIQIMPYEFSFRYLLCTS